MDCTPYSIELEPTFSGDTWDGLSWAVSDVDADDTRFEGTLTRAVFQFVDSDGNAVLTLDSDTAGQITLTTTTANAWDVTVEPRVLTLSSGVYSWAMRMFDDSISPDHRKVAIGGTVEIKTNPVSI